MNSEVTTQIAPRARAQKERKVYHSPQVEDYGAVNELTRSGTGAYSFPVDGPSYYTSVPG